VKKIKVAGLLVIIAFFGAGVRAQQVTGRILGTAADASDAAVPNVQITITNQDTGAVRNLNTGPNGTYIAPQLPAGTYTVKAVVTGFTPLEVQNVVVTVATDTRVDLKLQVGSVQQTVEVAGGAAPQVDTTSASVGNTLGETSVAELPLNGRNWVDLTLLQPGVIQQIGITQNINGVSTNPGMSGIVYSVNGASPHSNFVSIDGANMVTELGMNSSSITGSTLGVDGIKEYKVVTNMFSAEYGMSTGSQTTIVSKGGTNQFHGDVFEYLRNSSLDARNYFDPLDTLNVYGFGTNKSAAYPGKRLPPFRRNDFGGSFGGPIRKDKTFFYATYEGIRARIGDTIATKTLPAGCYVNGVVPAVIQNNGCVSGSATTPITVNSYILPLANDFPAPNVTGYTTFNYTFPFAAPATENYGQIRFDQVFSDKDTFFVRYTQDQSHVLSTAASGTGTGGAGYPNYTWYSFSGSQFATLSETHIFTPALGNTLRLSYSRTPAGNISLQDPSENNSRLRLVSGNLALQTGLLNGSISPGGGVTTNGPNVFFPATLTQQVITLADDVFWSRGKHSLKFGTLMNHYIDYADYCTTCNGSASFSSLANFFVGDYSSFTYNIPNDNPVRRFLFNTFGFYAQDDYHVSQRVMLNLGLRYEFATTPHETNAADAYSLRFPSDPSGTQGDMFQNPTLHGFSPRLGVAWDVFGNGSTSVRGGAGIYYDVAPYGPLFYTNAIAAPPIASSLTLSNTLTTPAVPFSVPLPLVAPILSPRMVDYNIKEPTMYQYNLTIQKQLPWGTALSVGYVGSRGIHLYQIREGNPAAAVGTYGNDLPIFGCWNATQTAFSAVTGSGACPAGFANTGPRVNPAWQSIIEIKPAGVSYYNSLQAQLSKQMSHQLSFQVAYVWGKLLSSGESVSAAEALANPRQLPAGYPEGQDRGPIVYDLRQSLRASATYHVPTIQFTSRLIDKALNGWWFSSIVSAQGGYPFQPTLGSDRFLIGGGNVTQLPNYGAAYNPSTVIEGSPNQWFNPTMYALQPAGTIGNVGIGTLRGPHLTNVDFSAVKDTKLGLLGEAGLVEFRAEVFNLMNRPDFSLPNATVWSATGSPATVASGDIGTTAIPAFSSAGQITSTVATSRQIQFALKVIF